MKDFYTISEFARLVDRAQFTIREWCRRGHIRATMHCPGGSSRREWRISHEELMRYRNSGLLRPKLRDVRRDYYTLPEFALLIGHDVQAVWIWCRLGLIRAELHGPDEDGRWEWRIPRANPFEYPGDQLGPSKN